ncbi:hypothetical protein RND81_04G110400 [Saponaria officinalis]|uniref:PGG domain-containing protein n=1 Tax=Saponaria officinalis TaxID=3572 RepID=A0AAW1LDK8_SAPOF
MTWDRRVDLGCVNKEGFTSLDAAQYYMESPPSFDKRLTWTALKAAGAPESRVKETPITNPTNPIESQRSKTVDMNNYKDRVNTLLVVATLVATVTFASGLTVPGGYNNSDPNQGMATMLENKAFQMFILSDTIAMYSSILVTISLIWAQLGDINLVFIVLRVAIPLLGVSLAMIDVVGFRVRSILSSHPTSLASLYSVNHRISIPWCYSSFIRSTLLPYHFYMSYIALL